MNIFVPELTRRCVSSWYGSSGRDWCLEVVAAAKRIADDWELRPVEVLNGGSHSLILRCESRERLTVVLKLPYLNQENRREPEALRAYDGRGAVKLFRWHPQTGAMLLENIYPGYPLCYEAGAHDFIYVICSLLAQLRFSASSKCDWFAIDLWLGGLRRSLDEICSRCTLEQRSIVEFASRLVEVADRWDGAYKVVNADPHFENILCSSERGWLLIDPKPMFGPAGFEGGRIMSLLLKADGANIDIISIAKKIAPYFETDQIRLLSWALIRVIHEVCWAFRIADCLGADHAFVKARCLSEALLSVGASDLLDH